jgi:hypothetical protein
MVQPIKMQQQALPLPSATIFGDEVSATAEPGFETI